MKNYRSHFYGDGALVVLIVWHITIAVIPKTIVSGILMTKPEAGYVWEDMENSDARFFWQNTGVKWQVGIENLEFKTQTTEIEGQWVPAAGYKFVNESKGLNTVWQPGLLHPEYMAWSAEGEGDWIPVTGYKFIYDGNTFKDCIWEPNKHFDDIKVTTGPEPNNYAPYPGYSFVSPGKTLDVVWTPGIVHISNSRLIAGTKEGTWITNYKPGNYSSSRTGEAIKWMIIGAGVDRVINRRYYYGY